MSKIVECPIKRFPGTVTLRDPIPFRLIQRWEAANYGLPSKEEREKMKPGELVKIVYDVRDKLYPIVIEIVETWNLKNILTPALPVTAENFPNAAPGTSANSTNALVAWLMKEVGEIYKGNEDNDPNE